MDNTYELFFYNLLSNYFYVNFLRDFLAHDNNVTIENLNNAQRCTLVS